MTTIPGIGAICATAMEALAPSAAAFPKGRDFAAWIGLTPKQNSSGGKERRERHRKWAARFAAAAHHWRHDRRPLGEATRRAGWYLAGKNDSDETAKANCSRSGQQIGAYRLGSHGPRGVYEDPAPGPA
ncbi:transposase [Sinorhizobium meliloti]|uniref:transposase n=1 Tax=Rhizobium meliloti TaxID=382 RepID=UPI00138B0338|nr:transposase [Sinorhizobium meliloti]